MLRRLLILTLLGTAAAPAALAADGAIGTIEICRASQPGDTHIGKTIEIPAGAWFGDTGHGTDRRGNYWPLWIVTTESITIGAAESCAKTGARIASNLDKHPIRSADERWFTPSVAAAGTMPGWPGSLVLGATALTDFR